MKRAALTTASAAMLACMLDPARVVMSAVGLNELRKTHPEMFDGALAAAAVERCIAEDWS